jgi:ketosteroid isomerase-like protein
MTQVEKEIWDTVHRHLEGMLRRDVEAYVATTSEDLSLYEWFVTPHRQDGLPFHLYMIENNWSGSDDSTRYDLWEPRLQLYGNTAIVSYTFMLTTKKDGVIHHGSHNESRVLVKDKEGWKVVHVHKSPGWPAPHDPA